jgi:hypothetical protein
VVVFNLAYHLLECVLHDGSSRCLDLAFHGTEVGVCIQFDLQRYCDRERALARRKPLGFHPGGEASVALARGLVRLPFSYPSGRRGERTLLHLTN